MTSTSLKHQFFPLPPPHSFQCTDYVNDNGEKETVKAVIVPLNFIKTGVYSWLISWACNYGHSCKNKACRYSYGLKQVSRNIR